MIPILVLAGLIVGFLPRSLPTFGIIAISAVGLWLFADDDLINGWPDAIFAFVWSAINAAAGAFIAWLIKRFITNIRSERRA